MPIEDVAMSDTSKELTIRSTPLIVCWNHTNFKVEVGFCCWCEIERLRVDLSDSSAEIVMNHTEIERLKAFIADRIHDATRERMLMEVEGE